ncbi:hypothetical protein ALC56_00373 [Trachymyrmex septentrionalis]|uniref:Uncharacterized protein n=1 Tax=Trachymyrmex septentrionalis TaxID=34720 RepID=A0A195FXG0_9HYME|nr:hypothetical protein ALC56_00373 [Trachymyrmex septentrionalis]
MENCFAEEEREREREREREKQPLGSGKGVTRWLVMVHDYARCRSSHSGVSGDLFQYANRTDITQAFRVTSAAYAADQKSTRPGPTIRCGAARCGAARCGAVRCSAVRCRAHSLIGWRTSNSKSKPESYIPHPISTSNARRIIQASTIEVRSGEGTTLLSARKLDAHSELNKVLPSPNELTLGENQSSIWLPSLVANG